MKRIETIRDRRYSTDGEMLAVADLQVSTAGELPTLGDTVNGARVQAGSIAQIIQTGQWATLDENGKWYADGSEVSAYSASTLAASLTLGKTIKPDAIEPESLEPDELETAEPESGEEDAELL